MKINIAKLPVVLKDEFGNEYVTKHYMPTGRMVDFKGKFQGWNLLIGKYLVRISK